MLTPRFHMISTLYATHGYAAYSTSSTGQINTGNYLRCVFRSGSLCAASINASMHMTQSTIRDKNPRQQFLRTLEVLAQPKQVTDRPHTRLWGPR